MYARPLFVVVGISGAPAVEWAGFLSTNPTCRYL